MKRTTLFSIAVYVCLSMLHSVGAYLPSNNPKQNPAAGASSPQLQGTWVVAASESDGEKSAAKVIRALGQSLTIKGNKFQETIFKGRSKDRGDLVDETRNGGTLKINPASKPREIDFIYDLGPLAGKRRKGIYRWEKDRLVVCINTDGGDRPQEFKTQKGDKTDLSVYRRR